MTTSTEITDIERTIIRSLDGEPIAREDMQRLTKDDAIAVATALDGLVSRGLVDNFDGEYFPTADGIRTAWS